MKIIIAGRTYSIESLDPLIDQCFVDLHAAYFSNQPLKWDRFKNQAIEFFNKHNTNNQITAGYFHNFTIIWKYFLAQGLWDLAESIWPLAMEPVLDWEAANKGKRIHKGTPYYFWGMTCIQSGDIDRGYAIMHQALVEDVITSQSQHPDTPAYAFATLNYEKLDQAFRIWVLREAQYLGDRIEGYSNNRGRKFALDEFKKKFLQAPPNTGVLNLLSYIVARLIRIESLPSYLLSSPFAGQLLQNLLFDLIQVVDISIAEKNKPNWKMIDHVYFLSRKSGMVISKANLIDANTRFNTNFENTLTEILDNTFKYKDGLLPAPLQSDLLVLYGLRNQGAHGVSSTSITWQRFNEIRNAIFNSLFLVSEILY